MADIPPPPVAKTSAPTPQNVKALDQWLTIVTAFHPRTAGKPWIFYEQIDAFLGPWGQAGYPIAYGKKYCQLFYGDPILRRDPAGAQWVQRTLRLLQDELHKYILERFRAGTLGTITADQLRDAAFDSHPKAYTQAGLSMIVLLSPGLTKEIAQIPATEYRPTSPGVGRTIKQIAITTTIIVPEIIANTLAALSGPAHTQSWQIASARDAASFQNDRLASIKLDQIRILVKQGQCDHLDTLDALRASLESTTFADEGADNFAGTVVREIERRAAYVNMRYQRESARDRELRDIFREFDERACTWRP